MKKKITLALSLLSLIGLNEVEAQRSHLRLRERFVSKEYQAPIKKSDMGNPDSSMFYNQMGLGGPVLPSSIEIYTYDGNGNVVKQINKSASDGQIYSTDSIIYDNQGREIEYYRISNFNGSMRITRIEYYKYGANNFQTIYNSYDWDGSEYKFSEADSTVLVLDSENRVTQLNSYYASSSSNNNFEPSDLIELSYNGLEKLPSSALVSNYDNSIMNYTPSEKIDHLKWRTSNPNNNNFFEENFTEAYYYEYDMGNWIPLAFDSCIVNNGRVETRFNFEWDGSNIYNQAREIFTFDNKNTLVKREQDVYLVSFWVNTYTSSDSIIYGPGDIHLDIYNTTSYTNQQGTQTFKSRRQNFFPSNVKTNKPNAVIASIYPNPANDVINLKLKAKADRIEIINLEGRVVKQINNNIESSIDIQGLTPGMYIIRLSNQEGIQNIKFIKQ